MNTSIWSHYSSSILMHNLSHSVLQHIRYAFLIVFNVCKIKLLNLNIVYPKSLKKQDQVWVGVFKFKTVVLPDSRTR